MSPTAITRLLSRCIHTRHSINTQPRSAILIYPEHRVQLTLALAQRIRAELQSVYLNAFVSQRPYSSPLIPYTVIITSRTLEDGVLYLNHYSPRIKEEVHVSNLTDRLLLQSGAMTLRCTETTEAPPPPPASGAYDQPMPTTTTTTTATGAPERPAEP